MLIPSGIAGQLGVRSLPTVMVIKDGQPVDGFAGAQPEAQIRELLAKYLPAPWEALIQQANELMAADNFNEALTLLRQAYQDSGEQAAIAIDLALVYLHLNRCDEAEQLLSAIPIADQTPIYEQAMAQLQLKRKPVNRQN